MSKFRIFLDYEKDRMILEPAASFGDPFDRAFSGLAVQAEGTNYRTFRIMDVLENSPATEAGLQKDDIITAIDDKTAAGLTLTDLNDILEKTKTYSLTVQRGAQTLKIKLTTRKLI